jgi:predicted O-methyltransferase YrrM
LGRRLPALAGVTGSLEARIQPLLAPRQDYITSVSRDVMAASAEFCALAQEICRRWDARRVADLGSGFSSYALRSFAREHGSLEVLSADDQEEWLEKTRQFLRKYDLPTDHCVTWASMASRASVRGTFDVVTHDLGHAGARDKGAIPQRSRYLEAALDLLRPGGLILLDDMHAQPYRSRARSILRRRSLEAYPMVRATIDQWGRYAWLAVMPASATSGD